MINAYLDAMTHHQTSRNGIHINEHHIQSAANVMYNQGNSRQEAREASVRAKVYTRFLRCSASAETFVLRSQAGLNDVCWEFTRESYHSTSFPAWASSICTSCSIQAFRITNSGKAMFKVAACNIA